MPINPITSRTNEFDGHKSNYFSYGPLDLAGKLNSGI